MSITGEGCFTSIGKDHGAFNYEFCILFDMSTLTIVVIA